MLQPDNFLYFLTLFTFSIFSGTYLLFNYYTNRLLITNAVIFFLCAARIAFEYYLQTIPTYEAAHRLIRWQGYGIVTTITIIMLQWLCVWYYTKPFKNFKKEKILDGIFVFGLFVLPYVSHSWYIAQGDLFYFAQEKIEGYWKFTVAKDFWYYPIYNFHSNVAVIFIILIMFIGAYQSEKYRMRKFILALSYIIISATFLALNTQEKWNIPRLGIINLIFSVIIAWYVSEYRLFKNTAGVLTKDLFNSISDLTISTDHKLTITNLNQAASLFFLQKFKNIRSLLSHYIVDKSIAVDGVIDQVFRHPESIVELTLKNKSKVSKTMSLKAAKIEAGETLIGYTFLLTDLTEIRRQEEELRKLNNTKDHLFAIIGHDLRKPALAFKGIKSKVDRLIQRNETSLLNELGVSLEESALKLNNLLDNLLSWAFQQKGTVLHKPSKVSVKQKINDVIELFSEVAAYKQIRLINQLSASTQIFVDQHAFSTIIRNILDNALKFSHPNGEIRFSESHHDHHVIIAVKDQGIGIAPQQLKNILTATDKKSTKGTFGEIGTGLGFELIHELLRLNNGTLEATSELNKGSTFFIGFKKVT